MKINKWTRIELFVYPSLVIFGLLVAWSAFVRPFGHDEFEAIHTSWKMWSGERIYIDFFQHHHFLYYPILGWLISIFGADTQMVLAARGVSFVMVLGMVWLTYQIARMRYTREIALFSAFFLSTAFLFIDKGIEVRPDVPQAFMGMLAIYWWLYYDASKERKFLFLSALALFLSFLFLQKAIFLIALLGLYTLYRLVKRTLSLSDFFFLWGALGIMLAGFVGYLGVNGMWSEYVFLNWKVNTVLLNTFPPLEYLGVSFTENPVFWLAFLVGCRWLFWQKKFHLIGWLALGLLATVLIARTPFAQYYLMALPFAAIVASEATVLLMGHFKEAPVLVVLGLSMLYPAYLIYDEAHETNAAQLRKVEYVLSITESDDLIYDGDANFNLFRKDMDYFWFSVRPERGVLVAYQLLRPYAYDPYLLIEERRPKLISDSFLKTKNPVILEGYTKSEKYKDLWLRK